jgi:hypothetical protein
MIQWGKETMEKGLVEPKGRMIEGAVSNGLQFNGYIENGAITNFFPVLP